MEIKKFRTGVSVSEDDRNWRELAHMLYSRTYPAIYELKCSHDDTVSLISFAFTCKIECF